MSDTSPSLAPRVLMLIGLGSFLLIFTFIGLCLIRHSKPTEVQAF